jgi:hypothetical protein
MAFLAFLSSPKFYKLKKIKLVCSAPADLKVPNKNGFGIFKRRAVQSNCDTV